MDIDKIHDYLKNPASIIVLDQAAPEGTRAHMIGLLDTHKLKEELLRQQIPLEEIEGLSDAELIRKLGKVTVSKWINREFEEKSRALEVAKSEHIRALEVAKSEHIRDTDSLKCRISELENQVESQEKYKDTLQKDLNTINTEFLNFKASVVAPSTHQECQTDAEPRQIKEESNCMF